MHFFTTATAACALFLAIEAAAQTTTAIPGSSLNLDKASYPSWMSRLPSSALLSHVTLPGTHDTMTYFIPNSSFAITSLYAETQEASSTLAVQLNAGMRYLDIRLQNVGSELQSCHGTVPILQTVDGKEIPVQFSDVLSIVKSFLAEYPTETVVMRVKQEEGDDNFGAVFANYTAFFDKTHQYAPADASIIPTLAEVRGKYIMLQDFTYTTTHPSWGYLYAQFTSTTEDDYVIISDADLAKKYTEAVTNMEAASTNRLNGSEPLYLTHLSGTTDGASADLAWDPVTVSQGVNGTNSRVMGWMQGWSEGGKVARNAGIVITDFCGDLFVKTIIQVNGADILATTTATNSTTPAISTTASSSLPSATNVSTPLPSITGAVTGAADMVQAVLSFVAGAALVAGFMLS